MASSNSINTTNFNLNTADERADILAWLSSLDPKFRHQDIQGRRVENVGEWVLQTEEFRTWYASSEQCESDNAVLFCYGEMGAGKTFTSSLVIDTLCDQAGGQNTAVACFYFDFATRNEQSPARMLGSLLKQLVCGQEDILQAISRVYQDQKYCIGGRAPQLSAIVKMLQATCSKRRTFICIDALDECVAGHRVKVLDSLDQILQISPGTRIFITGRPHILPEIQRHLAGRITSISTSPKRGDILRYLRTRLAEDTAPYAMDSSLEADILEKIPKDISEMFLPVSLNIDRILQETTIHRRRQKLSTMTDGSGLGDAYGATLSRIIEEGGEKARLGMAALMWISYSERPMKPDELCHALAIDIGSPTIYTDNVPSMWMVLACCQGLIAVDKEASTVRLIHSTLQRYLRARPEFFGTAHSTMAETCLSYLNSQCVMAISPNTSPNLPGLPFLEYSSLYWGTHAERDLSLRAKSLALKLLENCGGHISSKIIIEAQGRYGFSANFDRLSLFRGLHCASIFGIVGLVASLVEVEGCDINQTDCVGNTALAWAAWYEHEGVVEMLLKLDDINPDKLGDDGLTPLSLAARNGREGIVKMPLGRDDVNPDKPDNKGQTPVFYAAFGGHEGVVKILLERDDVNPDKPNNKGQTPLSYAAIGGNEGVVKILLERGDVNPNKSDNQSLTPLLWATKNGHAGVVALLRPGSTVVT